MKTTEQYRAEFSKRLDEICDDLELPKRGRQTLLAEKLGVKQQAVGKWFNGGGYPEMDRAVALAELADVNVQWLLMGAGPKRGNSVPTRAIMLDEAITDLPSEERLMVLDYIQYQFKKVPTFQGSRVERYTQMIESFKKPGDAKH